MPLAGEQDVLHGDVAHRVAEGARLVHHGVAGDRQRGAGEEGQGGGGEHPRGLHA